MCLWLINHNFFTALWLINHNFFHSIVVNKPQSLNFSRTLQSLDICKFVQILPKLVKHAFRALKLMFNCIENKKKWIRKANLEKTW